MGKSLNIRHLMVAIGTLMLITVLAANSYALVNGDFEDGLNGWEVFLTQSNIENGITDDWDTVYDATLNSMVAVTGQNIGLSQSFTPIIGAVITVTARAPSNTRLAYRLYFEGKTDYFQGALDASNTREWTSYTIDVAATTAGTEFEGLSLNRVVIYGNSGGGGYYDDLCVFQVEEPKCAPEVVYVDVPGPTVYVDVPVEKVIIKTVEIVKTVEVPVEVIKYVDKLVEVVKTVEVPVEKIVYVDREVSVPGPIQYVEKIVYIKGHDDNGHGNDEDKIDESNPGKKYRKKHHR